MLREPMGTVRAKMTMRPVLWLLVAALSGAASAQHHVLGDLSIHGPWARELPPVAPNGAAYLRIENGGNEAARVISASSPIAGRVEIHAHEMNDGVMKMRHLHSVEVPAQGALTFEPGGLHLMLIGLGEPLVRGESFPLTLEFDTAGTIDVTVEITAGGMADHSDHGATERDETQ